MTMPADNKIKKSTNAITKNLTNRMFMHSLPQFLLNPI